MSNLKLQKFPDSFTQFKHLYWIEPFNNRLDGDDLYPIAESEIKVRFCRIKGKLHLNFVLPCWWSYGVSFPIAKYWREKTKTEILKWEKEKTRDSKIRLLGKIKKEFAKDINTTKVWAKKLKRFQEMKELERRKISYAFFNETNKKLGN